MRSLLALLWALALLLPAPADAGRQNYGTECVLMFFADAHVGESLTVGQYTLIEAGIAAEAMGAEAYFGLGDYGGEQERGCSGDSTNYFKTSCPAPGRTEGIIIERHTGYIQLGHGWNPAKHHGLRGNHDSHRASEGVPYSMLGGIYRADNGWFDAFVRPDEKDGYAAETWKHSGNDVYTVELTCGGQGWDVIMISDTDHAQDYADGGKCWMGRNNAELCVDGGQPGTELLKGVASVVEERVTAAANNGRNVIIGVHAPFVGSGIIGADSGDGEGFHGSPIIHPDREDSIDATILDYPGGTLGPDKDETWITDMIARVKTDTGTNPVALVASGHGHRARPDHDDGNTTPTYKSVNTINGTVYMAVGGLTKWAATEAPLPQAAMVTLDATSLDAEYWAMCEFDISDESCDNGYSSKLNTTKSDAEFPTAAPAQFDGTCDGCSSGTAIGWTE